MGVTKQTIAIIGAAGNLGSAIAKSIADGNYRLLLFDRTSERLDWLMDDIQANYPDAELRSMDCAYDCSWEADIIIFAVPHRAEKEIADKIREVATQKIVISTANPVDQDLSKLNGEQPPSAAEKLQHSLPNSKVVKAFNTTFADDFENLIIAGKRLDAFIAGDDDEALQTVSELVKTAGFNPIIAGDLTVSSTLERMQLLFR